MYSILLCPVQIAMDYFNNKCYKNYLCIVGVCRQTLRVHLLYNDHFSSRLRMSGAEVVWCRMWWRFLGPTRSADSDMSHNTCGSPFAMCFSFLMCLCPYLDAR